MTTTDDRGRRILTSPGPLHGAEQRLHLLGGSPLERFDDVLIEVGRQADLAVAEHFLDQVQVFALDQQRRACGAQVVEPLPGQAGPLKDRVALLDQVPRVHQRADHRGEDQVVILPALAGQQPFLELPNPLLAEGIHGVGRRAARAPDAGDRPHRRLDANRAPAP
jgi:hypothetical protein